MGLRYFRRLRLLPGLTLNLSKSGISAGVGVRGVHVMVGQGKARVTAGSRPSYPSTSGAEDDSGRTTTTPRVTDEPTTSEKLAGWLVFAAAIGLSVLVIEGINALFR